MRHAVAPAENVENNSFAVTDLLKICSHCERLSKKVRNREKRRLQGQITLSQNASPLKRQPDVAFFSKFCHIIDVFRRRFSPSEQTSCSAVFCARLVYEEFVVNGQETRSGFVFCVGFYVKEADMSVTRLKACF